MATLAPASPGGFFAPGEPPTDGGASADGGFDLLLAMALEVAPIVPPQAPAPDLPMADPAAAAEPVAGEPVGRGLVPRRPETDAPADASDPVGRGLVPRRPETDAALDASEPVATEPVATEPVGRGLVPRRSEVLLRRPPADHAPADPGVGVDQTLTDQPSVRAIASSASSAQAGLTANDSGSFTGADGRATAGLTDRDSRIAQSETASGGEPADGEALTLSPLTADLRTMASVRTAPAHAAGATLAPQLADGIQLAFERHGATVHMQLTPEGLGSVDLRVTSGESGLAIHIAVDDPATRDMIQAAVGQLSQTLEARGLSVAHLLVDLAAGQGGQDASARQPAQHPSVASQLRSGEPLASSENHVPAAEGPAAAYRIDYRV